MDTISTELTESLKNRILILDGAMGTTIRGYGLMSRYNQAENLASRVAQSSEYTPDEKRIMGVYDATIYKIILCKACDGYAWFS